MVKKKKKLKVRNKILMCASFIMDISRSQLCYQSNMSDSREGFHKSAIRLMQVAFFLLKCQYYRVTFLQNSLPAPSCDPPSPPFCTIHFCLVFKHQAISSGAAFEDEPVCFYYSFRWTAVEDSLRRSDLSNSRRMP